MDQRFDVLLSVPLVIEYEAVLTRPEHLEAASASPADVIAILDALVSIAEPVRLSFRWRPVLNDPSDDMVLETAVNGRADVLVTFNRRHFNVALREFRLELSSPSEFLARIRK